MDKAALQHQPAPGRARRRLLGLLAVCPALPAAPPDAWPLLPLALPVYSDAKNARTAIAAQDCVAHAAGVRWQRLHVPQARLQMLVGSGKAIGMSASMPGSGFLSTRGLFTSHGWIVLPRESAWAQGRPPAAGSQAVCVIRNDDLLLLPPFERRHGRPRRVERVDGGSDAALRMLMGERCDALLLGNRLGHEALVRNLAQRSQGRLTALPQPYVDYPVGFVTLQDGPLARWLPALDKAIGRCAPQLRELLEAEARD